MAITSTQSGPLNTARVATGAYIDTGTVAAFTITCGFKPKYVKIWNETSGDEEEWNEAMADAEAFKRVAAGTGALITSNGITPTSNGFTVGLDTDIHVTSEQLSWLAIG
ncbi:hypothetical protein HY469_02240 [Candidatus Roizmanbacteria bacterium]|nr:hypothetical protein [Candidatus Roizmanbacteria bacterium]